MKNQNSHNLLCLVGPLAPVHWQCSICRLAPLQYLSTGYSARGSVDQAYNASKLSFATINAGTEQKKGYCSVLQQCAKMRSRQPEWSLEAGSQFGNFSFQFSKIIIPLWGEKKRIAIKSKQWGAVLAKVIRTRLSRSWYKKAVGGKTRLNLLSKGSLAQKHLLKPLISITLNID